MSAEGDKPPRVSVLETFAAVSLSAFGLFCMVAIVHFVLKFWK